MYRNRLYYGGLYGLPFFLPVKCYILPAISFILVERRKTDDGRFLDRSVYVLEKADA